MTPGEGGRGGEEGGEGVEGDDHEENARQRQCRLDSAQDFWVRISQSNSNVLIKPHDVRRTYHMPTNLNVAPPSELAFRNPMRLCRDSKTDGHNLLVAEEKKATFCILTCFLIIQICNHNLKILILKT